MIVHHWTIYDTPHNKGDIAFLMCNGFAKTRDEAMCAINHAYPKSSHDEAVYITIKYKRGIAHTGHINGYKWSIISLDVS